MEPNWNSYGTQLKVVGFQIKPKGCLYHLESDSKIGHNVEALFLWKEKYHKGIFGVSLEIAIWEIINQSFSNIRWVSYESVFNENVFEHVSGMEGNYTCKRAADI